MKILIKSILDINMITQRIMLFKVQPFYNFIVGCDKHLVCTKVLMLKLPNVL